MNLLEARNKLEKYKQEHLLNHWQTLSLDEKNCLLQEIAALDMSFQQKPLRSQSHPLSPLTSFTDANTLHIRDEGKRHLRKNRMGCLVLAGGSGTRLNFSASKALYPITVIKQKTLIQLVLEKTHMASLWCGTPLSLAIMTSTDNHEEIVQYCYEHRFFGLQEDQIDFFTQANFPLFDMENRLFLSSPSTVAKGPNGNGSAFHSFVISHINEKWLRRGIETVNIVPIDNPLADPFDAKLLAYHYQKRSDMTLKATRRLSSEEKVGIIGEQQGNISIVEYSEHGSETDNLIQFPLANTGLFAIQLNRLIHLAHTTLPVHLACKTALQWTTEGSHSIPIKKYEYFLFDTLSHLDNISCLAFSREDCFSPLKQDPKPVQDALLKRDRKVLNEVTGLSYDSLTFELSPQFYYLERTDVRMRDVSNQQYLEVRS